MKKTLATTALILATASPAAFAQGMEGQRIGYNDKTDNGVSYLRIPIKPVRHALDAG